MGILFIICNVEYIAVHNACETAVGNLQYWTHEYIAIVCKHALINALSWNYSMYISINFDIYVCMCM